VVCTSVLPSRPSLSSPAPPPHSSLPPTELVLSSF
jgi:hypothetical protein